MKKIIFAISTLFCVAGLSFAQSKSLAEPNPEDVGSGSAASALREVSIEKFERDGAWNVHISPDAGVISARLFEGSPAGGVPKGYRQQPDQAAALFSLYGSTCGLPQVLRRQGGLIYVWETIDPL